MSNREPRHPWKPRADRRAADEAIQEQRDQEDKDIAIQILAQKIGNQGMLDAVLDQVEGGEAVRRAVFEKIKPFLYFVPKDLDEHTEEDAIADCPKCGFRRGSILQHACLGVN